MEPKNKVLIFRSTDYSGTIWIDQDREEELRKVTDSMPAITDLYKGISVNSFTFYIDRRYDYDEVKKELLKRLDPDNDTGRREYHIKEYVNKVIDYLDKQDIPDYSYEIDNLLGMAFLKVTLNATGESQVASWPHDFLKGLLLTENTVNTWAKSRVNQLVSQFKTLDAANDIFTKYRQAFDFVAEMRKHLTANAMLINPNYSGLAEDESYPSFSVTIKFLFHEDFPTLSRTFRWNTISTFHGENLINVARYELMDMLNELEENIAS